MSALVVPGFPAIEVGPGMFDGYRTMTELNARYAYLRQVVPQWHADGQTRGEIARHWSARAREIRGF